MKVTNSYITLLLSMGIAALSVAEAFAQRQMEKLGRGVIAVRQADGSAFVGWRLLGTDPDAMAFSLYRMTGGGKPVKLNAQPITTATSFLDEMADFTKANAYYVRPVLKGREQAASAAFTLPAGAPAGQYLSIRLQNTSGYVLAGPEYLTIFDGLSGAALATADYIPARHPAKHDPTPDEMKAIWGDGYGNRVDRFLAAVAYLDGKRPSLVMCRGYYTRSVIAAWDWRGGKLTHRWTFDSEDGTLAYKSYSGQGNHNLSVADVDGDGRDEIVHGAAAIDDDGKGLYSTGLGHGDALHVSDLDPARPGLEVFDIQERFDDAGMHFRDARTGEILWKKPSIKAGADGEGPGRGLALDIDPRHAGSECWVKGAGIAGLFNALVSIQRRRTTGKSFWRLLINI